MSAEDEHWANVGPDGATPLDPDEISGLRLSWVATREDLNAAEQTNIARALGHRRWRQPTVLDVLDDLALRQLHAAMFGEVWIWAGKYRATERSIGVAPEQISVGVRGLVDDARYWVQGEVPLPIDEAAAQFHHRLVSIHPFPNGNGRHARAAADLLLRACEQPPFTWGRVSLDNASSTREEYIAALRQADAGDLKPLLVFARS